MQKQSALTSLIFAASLPLAAHAAGKDVEAATTPDGRAAVETARALAVEELRQPLRVEPESVRVIGDWAFVTGQMTAPDGTPIDYAHTRWEEAAREGGVSWLVVALMRRTESGDWWAVDYRIGPTDVAWEDWAAKYEAPAELFAF